MRIAQIADFHFTRITLNPFRLMSKRLLGHINWLCKRRNHFFETQLDPLPPLFQELGVDLVLLGGDFSTTALPQEFELAKQFVNQIKQPWIAIPGNHDHYTYRSYRNKHFYNYFTNQPTDLPFTLKKDKVEAHKLPNGWWLVALDTALATNLYSSEGLFSAGLEKNLTTLLTQIPQSDPIIMLNHYPFFQNDTKRHNLKRGEALEELLRKTPRIRMYLHGHTHRHTVADLQVSSLPLILDSGSCAQGRKGAWNLIDVTDDQCKVSTYRWDHRWTKTKTEEIVWTRK